MRNVGSESRYMSGNVATGDTRSLERRPPGVHPVDERLLVAVLHGPVSDGLVVGVRRVEHLRNPAFRDGQDAVVDGDDPPDHVVQAVEHGEVQHRVSIVIGMCKRRRAGA